MILRVIFKSLSIIFTLFRTYAFYRRKFRKYVRRVRKSMIKHGIPRKTAKRLCSGLHPIKIEELKKFNFTW